MSISPSVAAGGAPSQAAAATHALGDPRDITAEVERVMHSRGRQAAAYGAEFAALWRTASECLLGGKLIRSLLALAVFDVLVEAETVPVTSEPSATTAVGLAVKPQSRAAAVRVAGAIELLHYSFLLHDDVIDGDVQRRGRPNLIGTILAQSDRDGNEARGVAPPTAREHWAKTSGILMGDLLLSAVHQTFARERLPEPQRLRLLNLLDVTITDSVAGEHLDVGLSDGIVPADLNTVLTMSRLKTATYSFELPLRAAAILAGAPASLEQALGGVGRHLGVAFQLQDDLLSVFGEASEHGKDPFSDLREGKETAIIAYARMRSEWVDIEPRFGQADLTEAEAREMRELLKSCGADRFVQGLIDEQIHASFALLSTPSHQIPTALTQLIGQLVERLQGRTV